MVELILNTPYEAFAKKVAKIFEEHGTVSLGARKYTEEYYEWQLIVRLDLKDWGFLVECKKSMRVPEFVKTDEELRAYLAMMLACEGYITWTLRNKEKATEPTTGFRVVILANTDENLLNTTETLLKEKGYTTSKIPYSYAGTKYVDRYDRQYVTTKTCYRLSITRTEEVRKFLDWLGPLPHPTKEAYRVWALRLLNKANGKPLR